MPKITNQGVVEALVTAYLTNDRNKGEAMREVGYSENYSGNGHCTVMFNRDDVKAEIRRQGIELVKKTGITKEQFAYDLEQVKDLAIQINQPSAAVSAIGVNIRLHGWDQVVGTAADTPDSLSAEELAELRKMAASATKLKLKQG